MKTYLKTDRGMYDLYDPAFTDRSHQTPSLAEHCFHQSTNRAANIELHYHKVDGATSKVLLDLMVVCCTTLSLQLLFEGLPPLFSILHTIVPSFPISCQIPQLVLSQTLTV